MSEDHTLVTMLVFILCATMSLTLATPVNNIYSLEDGHELFETFIKEHNKQYEGAEKVARFQIFLENLKDINLLNEESSNAVFGITKFMDLTKEEFIQTYTGFKESDSKDIINRKNVDQVFNHQFNYTAPKKWDWRSKRVVSKVKDQGQCGSCWAFSVTDNVESINAIKTGSIVEISQQQLVDCEIISRGCSGGSPDFAYDYLIRKGAMSSKSYPYKAKDGTCHYDRKKVVIHLTKYRHIIMPEQDIKEMLYKTGPLSIAIDAEALLHYHRGIIIKGCPSKKVNHAVLLVGYGREKGVDFWLIKNSWGESFGEKGYFKIKRGVNCLNIQEFGALTAVI